jgi:hypothetical protein
MSPLRVLHIWKVPDSNLASEISYPELRFLMAFLSPYRKIPEQ